MDSPEPASQEVQKHTDSMVTVPLSEALSNSEDTQPDWKLIEIPQTPVEPDVDPDVAKEETAATPRSNGVESDTEQSPAIEDGASARSRSSDGSQRSVDAAEPETNWAELEKTEQQESREEGSDESTALLLARLEQENNALVTNPKSGLGNAARSLRQSRAQSLHHIKKLINEPAQSSLRYSQLPTPPMTELEFWAALVADYPQTAQRLPTLTSNKIRSGVPPPLRGVVWPSLAGARDAQLMAEFEKLSGESSPYEGLIGKDIGRSFPNVEMFRDPNGEGQQMLGRVLRSFSLYDTKIGYCQGLGFVVGPLLMHMTDAEAFCVLVRLMDHYGLRTCYLPDLSGLHLRIYQFQNLLARHCPSLVAHLDYLGVESVYASQWFLSFFAVSCPLPMLLRIYDVIFLEGASETLMRVGLSLMQRNEKKIMACTEFEDAMQLLLSRSLWDTYACNADDLVNNFVSLTGLVTMESLQALEASYNQSQGVSTGISFPQMQAAASRFLGRLWAGNNTRSISLNPPAPGVSRPTSMIRRSASKQSLTSTLNSIESASSDASTALTESSTSLDVQKPRAKSATPQNPDRDLHSQIEDLLMALTDLQRQHADLTRELQKEREEREEDQAVAKSMLEYIKGLGPDGDDDEKPATDLVTRAEERFAVRDTKRSSILQTKHQLRDDLLRWKEMHEVEASRCVDLARRIDEHEQENTQLREQLREARTRIQDSHRERQRLERTVMELRAMKTPSSNTDGTSFPWSEMPKSPSSENGATDSSTRHSQNSHTAGQTTLGTGGLRELRLVRTNSQKSTTEPHPSSTTTITSSSTTTATATATTFNKRSSSLGLQSILATENHKPAPEETLLVELVNAKTAEAVAKQELEEVKAKLDALRKLVAGGMSTSGGGSGSGGASGGRPGFQLTRSRTSMHLSLPNENGRVMSKDPIMASKPTTPTTSTPGGGGGFFSGWGRRVVSTSTTESSSSS